MSTDKPSPPEGFETFESADEGDVDTVELEPGDVLEGIVLDLTEGESDYGPWFRLKIKDQTRGVVRYFAKGDVKNAAREERIEVGEPIWIAMDTEEATLERDDGTEVTYHPTKVALPGGD